jgi:hypothetical protein
MEGGADAAESRRPALVVDRLNLAILQSTLRIAERLKFDTTECDMVIDAYTTTDRYTAGCVYPPSSDIASGKWNGKDKYYKGRKKHGYVILLNKRDLSPYGYEIDDAFYEIK